MFELLSRWIKGKKPMKLMIKFVASALLSLKFSELLPLVLTLSVRTAFWVITENII